MANVYRTEVSVDPPVVTGPALSATEFGTRPAIFISAGDGNENWAIEARLAYHSYGAGPVFFEYRAEFYFYFAVTGLGDPGTGSFVSGTFFLVEADGNNGAAITSGFTMAIEKDEALDELRFVTPLGTVTKSLSTFSALDGTPLRMDGMAHQFVRPNGGGDGSAQWDWFDFYSKIDGTNFRGAALSDTAPGSWSGWTDVTFGSPIGAIANSANSQEPTRYRTKFTYIGADGARSGGSRQWRTWTGGDSVDTGPGGEALDAARAPEHGAIWAAYVYPSTRDVLNDRRSFDHGGSWTEGEIYNAGGTTNSSPNIVWNSGKLVAVWHNGTDILQSVSRDMGTVWGTPVTLSLMGTNPRMIVRADGLAFYFYIEGSDLKLARSADFGASFLDSPAILVAAGVSAQTVAAQFGSDGSIVVGWIAGGAWTQVRSKDLGLTFA